MEKLQSQVKRIQHRFPSVEYLTLCIQASNGHVIPIYKGLGFEEIAYIEKGVRDEPMYFYGMKIDTNSSVQPPSYAEFRAAMDVRTT